MCKNTIILPNALCITAFFCIALLLFLTFGITKTIESAIPVIAAIGEMVAGWVENSEKKVGANGYSYILLQ